LEKTFANTTCDKRLLEIYKEYLKLKNKGWALWFILIIPATHKVEVAKWMWDPVWKTKQNKNQTTLKTNGGSSGTLRPW
jgi:hypothetical protein